MCVDAWLPLRFFYRIPSIGVASLHYEETPPADANSSVERHDAPHTMREDLNMERANSMPPPEVFPLLASVHHGFLREGYRSVIHIHTLDIQILCYRAMC